MKITSEPGGLNRCRAKPGECGPLCSRFAFWQARRDDGRDLRPTSIIPLLPRFMYAPCIPTHLPNEDVCCLLERRLITCDITTPSPQQLNAFDQQYRNVQDQGATQTGVRVSANCNLRSWAGGSDYLPHSSTHTFQVSIKFTKSSTTKRGKWDVRQHIYIQFHIPRHARIASRKRHERHGDTSNGLRGPLLLASSGNGSG
ncbi:hypothetical protein EDB80DRAFT_151726 [Ilyonectria destructans]|nr:hypothetical protein EDB80DRAFT_151726 [Ilyonectria destructans]